MDLIRVLLLQIEGTETDLSPFSVEERVYHSALIIEAGLAHGIVTTDRNGELANTTILRLTWAGHDFLDAARNETIWRKAMGIAKEKGISMTLDVCKEVLSSMGRQIIGY